MSEAERECAAALAHAPRFWLALYATAYLALIRGEYGQSERLFKEIFPIDPLNADTYMELGLTLRAVGRFADAETAFRRGLAITPTYITGHFELGSILLAEGRIENARHAFELEAPEYGQQAGLAMAYHASGRNAGTQTRQPRSTTSFNIVAKSSQCSSRMRIPILATPTVHSIGWNAPTGKRIRSCRMLRATR